jgi:hypothetical protein
MYRSGYRKKCFIQPATDQELSESSQELSKILDMEVLDTEAPVTELVMDRLSKAVLVTQLVATPLAILEPSVFLPLEFPPSVSHLSMLVIHVVALWVLKSYRQVSPQSELPQLPLLSTRKLSFRTFQVRFNIISVETRLEYIPYQKAYIEYDQI